MSDKTYRVPRWHYAWLLGVFAVVAAGGFTWGSAPNTLLTWCTTAGAVWCAAMVVWSQHMIAATAFIAGERSEIKNSTKRIQDAYENARAQVRRGAS